MSKIYSRCGTSGGKLAHLLGSSVIFPYKNEDRYKEWGQNKERDFQLPIGINLGCKPEFLPEKCLNKNAIKSGDKLYVFEKLDEACIPHPMILDRPEDFWGPYLGRENFRSKGRGINFYKTREIPNKNKEHHFYVEYTKVKAEYRVHVFMGQVIIECNKRLALKGFIHTSPHGSKLEIGHISSKQRDKVNEYAIRTIAAVGLDFGAVDIIETTQGEILVLECNSDPCLAHVMGYIYAERINHVLGLERKFDWFITHKHEVLFCDIEKQSFYKRN